MKPAKITQPVSFGENPFKILETRLERIEDILKGLQSAQVQTTGKSLDTITLQEVIEITGYKKHTIYGFTSSDAMPFFKKGKRLFFSRVEIEKWLKTGNRS